MTDFIENTTLKLENLFMRQPTKFGRLNGKAKSLVRDNRFDYWEISTYVNGRQTGPFESRYVKNDKVREIGTYRNGHRTGRWKRYDINGKLEMEWEE